MPNTRRVETKRYVSVNTNSTNRPIEKPIVRKLVNGPQSRAHYKTERAAELLTNAAEQEKLGPGRLRNLPSSSNAGGSISARKDAPLTQKKQ